MSRSFLAYAQSIALILLLTLAPGHGQSQKPSAPAVPPVPAGPLPLVGKLATRGGKSVRVNGHKADRDTTIMPQDLIETIGCTRTVVQFGTSQIPSQLGSLVLAPDTKARVMYTENSVEVELMQGCVVLKPNLSVSGLVKTPDGRSEKSDPDPNKRSFIDVCYPENKLDEMATTYCCPPGAAWANYLPVIALAGLAALTTTTGSNNTPPIVVGGFRPPDPSGSTPR